MKAPANTKYKCAYKSANHPSKTAQPVPVFRKVYQKPKYMPGQGKR